MGPKQHRRAAAIFRRWRSLRFGLVPVALVAGAALALLVGASAFGDTVCGTTGGISDCAQWGVLGNSTRLAIDNTGTTTISSFTFTLPQGTTVSGVAGPYNSGCTWMSNQITCPATIEPGQTVFVDILYAMNQLPPVGSTGTLTMTDASGTPPGQTVPLQTATACGTNPCTISSTASSSSSSTSSETSTSTETSTTPPPGAPPPCQAKLKVTKLLASSNYEIKLHRDLYVTYKDAGGLEYEIFVKNESNCPATGVVMTDAFPHAFDCAGGTWQDVTGQQALVNRVHCKGEGRGIHVDIGTLGSDETAVVEVSGKFVMEHATANTAHATATNAPPERSDHVHVDVVSKKQFEADKGMVNH